MSQYQRLPRFGGVPRERRPAIDFAGNPRYRDYLKAVYDFNGHVSAAELQHLVPSFEPTERQQSAITRALTGAEKKRAATRQPATGGHGNKVPSVRRAVQNHLSKLHHHDYLRRYGAKNKVFYTLGQRAIEPLVLHFDADPARARRLLTRVREPEKFYFPHSRLICEVHVMTELALRNTQAALGFWRHDGEIETEVTFVDTRQKTRRVPIIPDAYFSIETQAGEAAHICLEADRATMTHERFTNKMVGYYRFWRRQGKRPAKSEMVLGVAHFRVLVVCPSLIRLEGLYVSTKTALEHHPAYTRAIGELKQGAAAAPSGIAFVHTDEFRREDGGYVFPDLDRRFVPFV